MSRKRPVAIIECFQQIPCNPCEAACPSGAIAIGEPITNLPQIDASKCTGCGSCISACPGLAIFMVDLSSDDEWATVSLPYEFQPLPVKGEKVKAMARTGRVIGEAVIVQVRNPISFDHTALVTVRVPKEMAHEVRGIKPGFRGDLNEG